LDEREQAIQERIRSLRGPRPPEAAVVVALSENVSATMVLTDC
jgi:hypothetical protein